MEFFASAITTLQTLVVALGAGLGVWGVVNLLEGYGSDNPGSNFPQLSQRVIFYCSAIKYCLFLWPWPRDGPHGLKNSLWLFFIAFPIAVHQAL